MFCSNCGASQQTPKSYCRKCGKWIGSAPPEEKLTVMIIFNALSALFAMVAALVLFVKPEGRWTVNLAATFCLIISVYQTLSFIFALNLKRRMKQGQEKSDQIETKERGQLPEADPADFIRPQSVTENTTELLERR
jgi:hypothetical protein